MASKNRLSVNFTSATTRSHIQELANVSGMSQSCVVEELVRVALSKDLSSLSAIANDPPLLRHAALTNEMSRHERLLLSAVKRVNKECLCFTPKRMVLRSFPFPSTPLPRKAEVLFNGPEKAVNTQWKSDLPNAIREHINTELPRIIGSFGETPDIIHIFLRRADVEYEIGENGDVSASITPHLYVLPLMRDVAQKYHLDHENIAYKNFKAMLTHEWRPRRYAQQLLLEHASSSRSGGYFVGFLHQPENNATHEPKDFLTINSDDVQVLFKIHIHARDIRLKRKESNNTQASTL